MPTLLEKAKKTGSTRSRKTKFSQEEMDLAGAWVNNEISLTQVSNVLNKTGTGNVYAFLALCLKSMLNGKK